MKPKVTLGVRRGSECATLTSFVHDKVSGAELMAVEVLDGDKVVGSDPPLQPAVLPHHVRCGFGEHHLHCNPAQGKKNQQIRNRPRQQGSCSAQCEKCVEIQRTRSSFQYYHIVLLTGRNLPFSVALSIYSNITTQDKVTFRSSLLYFQEVL